jgi:hypothetical protein
VIILPAVRAMISFEGEDMRKVEYHRRCWAAEQRSTTTTGAS